LNDRLTPLQGGDAGALQRTPRARGVVLDQLAEVRGEAAGTASQPMRQPVILQTWRRCSR